MDQHVLRITAAELAAELRRDAHGALETTLLEMATDLKARHGAGPYVVKLDFPLAVDGGGLTIACRLMSRPAKLVWMLCRTAARLWA